MSQQKPISTREFDGAQPQAKKKPGCLKVGAIILGILVVLGILVSAFGSDEETSSEQKVGNDAGQAESESSDAEEAAGVPEAEGDSVRGVGDVFTSKKGLEIRVNSFEPRQEDFLGSFVCANVTYTNNGDAEAKFQGYWDWKIHNPQGVITDPEFTTGNMLESGSLAPGGSVTGDVCADDAGPGEYRLIFEPQLDFFSTDKEEWVVGY